MRRQSTLSLAAAAYLLAGCNQPAVTPKAPDFQSSENTVRAWNDVAQRSARPSPLTDCCPHMGSPAYWTHHNRNQFLSEYRLPTQPLYPK
jgi:hypothetical protein